MMDLLVSYEIPQFNFTTALCLIHDIHLSRLLAYERAPVTSGFLHDL